jgi:branched-chain amino acid transport system permease protein
VLGVIESFTSYWFGPERSVTISFALLLVLLFVRPSGLMGRRGYE